MGRLHYRGGHPRARAKKGGEVPRFSKSGSNSRRPQLRADRKSLLLGTALASTLIFSGPLPPTPTHAPTNCLVGNPPPGRIYSHVADDIICVNVDNRFNDVGPM
jgi:hypothetical protein